MSTAFFHGLGKEYSEGLELSSEVFEQIFVDALSRRSRSNNPAGEDTATGRASSGLDEFTGNSLGQIDSHALLADSIGVDMVGRSTAPDDDRRPLPSSRVYGTMPASSGIGQNPLLASNEMSTKSLDSLLALSSDALVSMGNAPPLNQMAGVECPSRPQILAQCLNHGSYHPQFQAGTVSPSVMLAQPAEYISVFPNAAQSALFNTTPAQHMPPMSSHQAVFVPSSSHSPSTPVDRSKYGVQSSVSNLPVQYSPGQPALAQGFPAAKLPPAGYNSPSSASKPGAICMTSSPSGPMAAHLGASQVASLLRTPSSVASIVPLQSAGNPSPCAVTMAMPAVGSAAPVSSMTPYTGVMYQDPAKTIKRKRKRVRATAAAASATESTADASGATPADNEDSPRAKCVKGGWPKGKPRTRRDIGEPRPVLSSWQFFISDEYKSMDKLARDAQLTKNMKHLAAKWQALPDSQKKMYDQKAASDKQRYLQELKEFQNSEYYGKMLSEKVQEQFGGPGTTGDMDSELMEVLKHTAEVENTKDLYCALCKQLFTTQHNHQEHLLGKKHLQNVKKNAALKLQQAANQPLPTCEPDELLLSQKAESYMEAFLQDNRLRDVEIQELKTRNIVCQLRQKQHQTVLADAESHKTALTRRMTTMGDENKTTQRQLDGLLELINSLSNWQPNEQQHPASSSPPLLQSQTIAKGSLSPSPPSQQQQPSYSSALQQSPATASCYPSAVPISASCSPPVTAAGPHSYPCSPVTPSQTHNIVPDTMLLQKNISSLPSPPDSGSSNPASAEPPKTSTVFNQSSSISFTSSVQPGEWVEIPTGAHRIVGNAVVSTLPLQSFPALNQANAAAVAATNKWKYEGQSSLMPQLFGLAGISMAPEQHGDPAAGANAPSLANLAAWNDWWPSNDLSVSQ